MTRMRALLIVEAANPEWPSVPLVGYSHARALFAETDAHLVTQVRNTEALERAGLRKDKDFTALDSEPVASPLYKGTEFIRKLTGLGWTFETAMQVPPYYYFEHLFWKRFGAEITAGKWDVVHRITPLSPTTPSIIARRCRRAGVPFVWGPINGGVPWPPGYGSVKRREGEWLHSVRDAYKLLPGYRSTLTADAILTGSIATYDGLPEEVHSRTIYMPENGVDPSRFPNAKDGRAGLPLKIAFIGRLVPYKGADILLEAAADHLRAGTVEIEIFGDGPERENLAAQVKALGVEQQVRMPGWVPHKELGERLRQFDVLGFPSIREFGGGVVLEAMAVGLVPIIVDYGGPSELVTEQTGFKMPVGPRGELVANLKAILDKCVRDYESLHEIGQRARTRVLKHFTWDVKAKQTVSVYHWVKGRGPRPDFGMPFPD